MPKPTRLPLEESHLRPGLRLGVAVSGGADSVALLRVLLGRREALGLVLSVVHVHHGIRGVDADKDADFVQSLAAAFMLPFHFGQLDVPDRVQRNSETLEEAARHLRYGFFHELLQTGQVDAIATAHTLDDQAETVLQKLLRGAWTEGLGGISPVIKSEQRIILRPLLQATRAEVENWLNALGQSWCEDATNQDKVHTRNRVRHELLPVLRSYNPRISSQLSRLAAIARDEEAYWQREISRIGPALMLPGKPVRGGGRSSSTHPEEASVALELERLRTFQPAVQRRLLRWFAGKIGCALDFEQTESLLHLAVDNVISRRLEINSAVYVQRTAREIQFVRQANSPAGTVFRELSAPIPGLVDVPELGHRFTFAAPSPQPAALIRSIRPGDRVTQRYTRGPRKIKEILERNHLSAEERQSTPVVVWPASDPNAPIVWLRGVDLDPASLPELPFTLKVEPIPNK